MTHYQGIGFVDEGYIQLVSAREVVLSLFHEISGRCFPPLKDAE